MSAPSGPPPPPGKGSNRGCLIGLGILGVIVVMLMIGAVVAAVFVGRAVDEAVEDEGIPGLFGGECLEFQAAYMTMSFSGFLGAGVDDAQMDQLEQDLGDLEELAPSEIRDDLAVVASAMREAMRLGTGGQGLVGNAEVSEEETQQAEAVLERPEVLEAQENINRWVEDNCA